MPSHRPQESSETHQDGDRAAWVEPVVIRLHAGEAEGVDGTGTDSSGLNS